MELRRHWGMMAKEHITVASNFYEKVKTFNHLDSLLTSQILLYLKHEIHVIVQNLQNNKVEFQNVH